MIAVIFEVQPSEEGGYAAYLEHAARLEPALRQVDGFISVERFQSVTNPRKLVSLSFWRDEASVRAWREHAGHRATQAAGRAGIFDDYRLRVANVVRDYGLYERAEAPPFHAPVERGDRPHPAPPVDL
ncbi:MAG TPA: antibiotic biosynthesis monooxygenase [Burkholderiales bacterium]|jgi:heme-degrading monooxygenase HmoA